MEDATTFRPFTVKPCGLKEAIAFFEKEVVLNKLSTLIVVHCRQRVIGASKVTSELTASLDDFLLDLKSLLLCHTRS